MPSLYPESRTAISVPSERPKGAGQPCLVIIAGQDIGRRIDLGREEVSIGRSEQCTICVNSDLVSRKHATVCNVLGKYFVVDHKSTNGTYVNDQRVERAQLKDGDLIRTGKQVLKYMESNLELEYMQHILTLASVDALTGAYNKRHFDTNFAAAVAHAAQTRTALSLIVLDIDFFKKINDTYGHPAGDAVLKHVVTVVKGQLRASDTLSRVGGEEFAILLPSTPYPLARQAAELVRMAVEAAPCNFEAVRVQATLSLGVGELQANDTPEELYKRADAQLYAAKHGGRNRVC